jgi:hypothetical protein
VAARTSRKRLLSLAPRIAAWQVIAACLILRNRFLCTAIRHQACTATTAFFWFR